MQSTKPAEEATTPNTGDPTDLDQVKVKVVDAKEVEKRKNAGKAQRAELESRDTLGPTGNPNATIADPVMQHVVPRYDIVQNQSAMALIVPDLKTNAEDPGLMLYPGEVIKLTDFHSPMEINRSKGLRYAASKLPGLNGNFALVPLKHEDEGLAFKVPERQKYPKGTIVEDQNPNDFDYRFEELEMRDAKREEKLLKKTLAGRVTKKHGAAPVHV